MYRLLITTGPNFFLGLNNKIIYKNFLYILESPEGRTDEQSAYRLILNSTFIKSLHTVFISKSNKSCPEIQKCLELMGVNIVNNLFIVFQPLGMIILTQDSTQIFYDRVKFVGGAEGVIEKRIFGGIPKAEVTTYDIEVTGFNINYCLLNIYYF